MSEQPDELGKIIGEEILEGLEKLEDIADGDKKWAKLLIPFTFLAAQAKKTNPEVFLLVAFLVCLQYLDIIISYVTIIIGFLITMAFAGIKAKLNQKDDKIKSLEEEMQKKDFTIFKLEYESENYKIK